MNLFAGPGCLTCTQYGNLPFMPMATQRVLPRAIASADLNRTRRQRELNRANESTTDVLVIGGGITGVGIALDAASRGLTTTLIEARDLGYGTSRWSSKLIHGGLRYLAHGDVGVAWESARERARLMTDIAPHLIRPLPHVLPTLKSEPRGQEHIVRLGLHAGDVLRRAAGTPPGLLGNSRRLNTRQMLGAVGALNSAAVRSASGFWDGQLVDDARLVVAVARTAASFGARILTRVRAVDTHAHGAQIRDELTGEQGFIAARQVIIAAGVWAGEWDDTLAMRLSRGTHVLLPPSALGHPRAALTVAVPGEKSRYVFALPTIDGPIIAGLTDVEVTDTSPDNTTPPVDEQQWVLDHLSAALNTPLTLDHVMGAYSGYRPLVGRSDEGGSTADISRQHLIHHREDGVIIVTGGKLTTYRTMAADALAATLIARERPCRTAHLPLIGARGARDYVSVSTRLVTHYGDEAGRIEHLEQTDSTLTGTLEGAARIHRVEIAHAIEHEGALTVDDIISRRTRLSLEPEAVAAARSEVIRLARAIDPAIITISVDS